METRAAYAMVGAFVLALLMGLAIAVLWIAHGQFSKQNMRYDIYFASVSTGLADGSPVRISGVEVGRVVAVSLDPQHSGRVRVTIEVVVDAPIRSDSVASIEITGLTGGAAVEITPGSANAPLIEVQDDQRYPIIWSRESSLQQVVANVPQLLLKITDLTDKMGALLDQRNLTAFAATLDNLSRISGAAAAHTNDLEQMLANGAADTKDLHAAIRDLQDTMRAMQNTMRQFDAVAADATNTVRDVDALVKENRAPLRDFTQNGLSDLRDLVAQTQNLVATMTRTIDALDRDPARFLYGERRQGYKPQ
jgi:phospholipid/cholesterol/gamma-HCH transport system substrate-binding protein